MVDWLVSLWIGFGGRERACFWTTFLTVAPCTSMRAGSTRAEFPAQSHASLLSEHAQCRRQHLRVKRRLTFHFAIEVQQLVICGLDGKRPYLVVLHAIHGDV